MVAAILTGGRARRFHGRDKSRLVVDGRPILDHQLEVLGAAVSEILIVTSAERSDGFAPAPGPPPVRIVVDQYPGTGPLGAVVTALDATDDDVIVLAGDMPGVTRALVEALAAAHAEGDALVTVPASTRGLEPLCAVYGQNALPPLRAALEAGARSLQAILPGLHPTVVAAETLVPVSDPAVLFRNINAPDDLPR